MWFLYAFLIQLIEQEHVIITYILFDSHMYFFILTRWKKKKKKKKVLRTKVANLGIINLISNGSIEFALIVFHFCFSSSIFGPNINFYIRLIHVCNGPKNERTYYKKEWYFCFSAQITNSKSRILTSWLMIILGLPPIKHFKELLK